MNQPQQKDTSMLMLLAEVCCLELEKMRAMIFESFVKKKRTANLRKPRTMKENQNMPPLSFRRKRVVIPLRFECQEIAVAEPSKKKNKKRKQQLNPRPNEPMNVMVMEEPATPAWVEEATRDRLGSTTPAVWICDKILQKSDVKKHFNRIFIPRRCVKKNLFPALTAHEKQNLGDGISVLGLDQMGHTWDLQLTFWDSCKEHVIKKGWMNLVMANGFQAKDDTIQMWLSRYRHEDDEERICFLIGRKEG